VAVAVEDLDNLLHKTLGGLVVVADTKQLQAA
jgi:hypothetical protein